MTMQHYNKSTPSKSYLGTHAQTHSNSDDQQFDTKQFLPLLDLIPTWITKTPLKRQPQFLLSPSPIRKDLFYQLIGTQTKDHSSVPCPDSILEEQPEISQSSVFESDDRDEEQLEGCSDEHKKRKRKSTNQVKILKEEMEGQDNWSKEKISKMAELTGLSQSQVYKWFWDQKKKQAKTRDQQSKSFLLRRKHARNQYHNHPNTKIKLPLITITDHEPTTNKKIHTKLIFN